MSSTNRSTPTGALEIQAVNTTLTDEDMRYLSIKSAIDRIENRVILERLRRKVPAVEALFQELENCVSVLQFAAAQFSNYGMTLTAADIEDPRDAEGVERLNAAFYQVKQAAMRFS